MKSTDNRIPKEYTNSILGNKLHKRTLTINILRAQARVVVQTVEHLL
jgi:hypothetical protein